MNKNNVLLLEKQDESSIEVFEGEQKDVNGSTLTAKGIKIHRVVKPTKDGFETIVSYDPTKETVDITPLSSKSGYYMVSVDKDKFNNFIWTTFVLGDYYNSDDGTYSMITIKEKIRNCTDEEIELLNEVFPEYYDNCY